MDEDDSIRDGFDKDSLPEIHTIHSDGGGTPKGRGRGSLKGSKTTPIIPYPPDMTVRQILGFGKYIEEVYNDTAYEQRKLGPR
ncbi:hypothetical protein LIER_38378 [Lithospermum erythrorhizon]|uniref:Uncharacterized protein n=1 Tax=Lithospermum erythrorhizon TaxID=34254 RepID=A0AAV3PYQ7_LITER